MSDPEAILAAVDIAPRFTGRTPHEHESILALARSSFPERKFSEIYHVGLTNCVSLVDLGHNRIDVETCNAKPSREKPHESPPIPE